MSERSVLIADLTGYTALTEAHGDHDAADVAQRFCELAREALQGGAWLVKSMGDAVLIVAPAPRVGLDTALALADRVEAEHAYPAVAAGLHVGSVVERDGDVFGAAVNLAARVAAHAPPGCLVATAAFAAALPEDRKGGLTPIGAVRFKNVLEPVELHRVERAAASAAVVDPVCRMRLDPGRAVARVRWADRDWYLCSVECAAAFRSRPEAYVTG